MPRKEKTEKVGKKKASGFVDEDAVIDDKKVDKEKRKPPLVKVAKPKMEEKRPIFLLPSSEDDDEDDDDDDRQGDGDITARVGKMKVSGRTSKQAAEEEREAARLRRAEKFATKAVFDEAAAAAAPERDGEAGESRLAAIRREKLKKKNELDVPIEAVEAEHAPGSLHDFSVSQSTDRRAGGTPTDKSVALFDESRGAGTGNVDTFTIEKFSIHAHKKVLFRNATLNLVKGRRYGLLGKNGCGKTTLLRHIASRTLAGVPAEPYRILIVEQESNCSLAVTPVEAVLAADERRTQLLEEESNLLKEMGVTDDKSADLPAVETPVSADCIDRLNKVYENLDAIGAAAAEGRARRILFGLGLSEEAQDRPVSSLSGGQRQRISLARALFMTPDCLLMDEPTNHLDLDAVLWLSEYLSQSWKGMVLIVSHDQDFLNSVCTDIIHVMEGEATQYRGSYDDFAAAYARKVELALREVEKAKKEAKKAITPEAQSKKALARMSGGAKNKGKPEKSKVDDNPQDEADKPKVVVVRETKKPKFVFEESTIRIHPPLLALENVVFGYPSLSSNDSDEKEIIPIFNGMSFETCVGCRIAITGRNGAGKSTLLNLLDGSVKPLGGQVIQGGRVVIGRYSQHFVDQLPVDVSPIDYLTSLRPEAHMQDIRQLLGSSGLEGETHGRQIKLLSGGQKARVMLSALSMLRPHVLLLDEPTNHLDIESVQSLTGALMDFKGAVVLVSHDVRMIESLECDLWVVRREKVGAASKVFKQEGGIAAYRHVVMAEVEAAALEAERVAAEKAKNSDYQKRRSRVLRPKEGAPTDGDVAPKQ